ncbi:glycosyltransferase family 4 protein [Neobacillus cucumis]|uniref:glycosyltransferase family 4 protein n=1 Tax=Neobacillus cucumis TaxID=1740721 RepID=UPI002E22494E|nr:glycosyltransferase family 4 protein [Neobacillus cucumis]
MKNILLVSNMYPSEEFPAYGVFVKNFVDICEESDFSISKIVMYKNTNSIIKLYNYLIYYIKILMAVLFKNYDIIYVHYGGQNSIPFYFLTKLKKINLIYNLHGSDVFAEKKVHEILLNITRRVIKRSNKIVVPSEYYKNVVSEIFEVSKDNIYIYPSSGVNENIFYPKDKAIARKNIGIDPNLDIRIIGYVGRIDFGKGWDVLLDSIKILHNKKVINPSDYKFIFIGDGKELYNFQEKVKKLDLEKYIVSVQSISQSLLCDYYNSFDMFCFPTKRKSESLGLVGIEALACGIPVIASDFAAPKFYIKNGYNGVKFELNSSEELAKCIEKYINLNPNEKEIISKNCIETSKPYLKKSISYKLVNDILK